MANFCAVCGCCTRTDIVREHLEDTLRICDVSAMGLYSGGAHSTNCSGIDLPVLYSVSQKKVPSRNYPIVIRVLFLYSGTVTLTAGNRDRLLIRSQRKLGPKTGSPCLGSTKDTVSFGPSHLASLANTTATSMKTYTHQQ